MGSISLVPPCIQPDCQRLPLFIPTARLSAFATLYPNSQTASVSHSLSQQPDCQRLPLSIPTARLPAFATLYPNSQTARVCHSLSQQPDCQRLPLFIPTARLLALLSCCLTSTEARWPIRDGDRVGRGRESERLDRGNRPKKTGETVERRQNNGSVKAVSPRHCPATCALCNYSFNCCAGQSH